MAEFLGNFPVRAQRLLQEPFLTNYGELWSDYFYSLLDPGTGVGGAPLEVWCYLANTKYITFLAGVAYGYRESAGADSWKLTCWRADIDRTRPRQTRP